MRYTLCLLAGALVLGMATAAVAQSDSPQGSDQNAVGQQQNVSGVVVSSDSHSLSITTDDGRSMTFAVDDQTMSQPKLSAGQRVKVQYDDKGSSSMHADNIVMDTSGGSGSSMSSNPPSGQSTAAPSDNLGTNPGDNSSATPSTPSYDTPSTSGSQPSGSDAGTTGANAAGNSGSSRLPATATPLPLVGLTGLLALGAGVLVRSLNRS